MDTSEIYMFLALFATLSKSEQKVFLYCVKECPHPLPYSGDLGRIQIATALSRTSVREALKTISRKFPQVIYYQGDRR